MRQTVKTHQGGWLHLPCYFINRRELFFHFTWMSLSGQYVLLWHALKQPE